MSTKLCKPPKDEFRLPNLGKKILEVKKRIQLSEGQRKALFEEIANETKRNADEIFRLKKEIAKVQLEIYEHRNNILGNLLPVVPPLPPTVSSAPCKRVTQTCGIASFTTGKLQRRSHTAPNLINQNVPTDDLSSPGKKLLTNLLANIAKQKSLKEIAEYLDLQRIDKNKQVDLLSYKYKLKQGKLKKMAILYQHLLLKKEEAEKGELDETKAKNAILLKEYRNRINAVQVQIKEAEHVRLKYKDIRWKLQEDGAKFESKMADIESEVKAQEIEILKIKQVNKDALKLRSEARNALQKEEKQVLAANATREKQSLEGRRLVEARQCDLAHLERHLYQGKPSTHQLNQENQDNQDEDTLLPEEEKPKDPAQQLKENIDILNEATGSTCIEEVLAKVKGQTTTQVRLMTLRKTKEKIKNAKQRKFDVTLMELEKLKFADDKSNQQNQDEVDEIISKIKSENASKDEINRKLGYIQGIIDKVMDKLLNTYLCMYQEEDPNIDKMSAVHLIRKINVGIENLLIEKQANGGDHNKSATVEELLEEMNEREGNWLPGPYNDIVRRTPVPNSGAPTPIPAQTVAGGSEDEEELPTRNYLKRQAQLVVDAKNKRKTLRFPIPKTK